MSVPRKKKWLPADIPFGRPMGLMRVLQPRSDVHLATVHMPAVAVADKPGTKTSPHMQHYMQDRNLHHVA